MRSWSPVLSFGFSGLKKILQFQEEKKKLDLCLFGEGHWRCICNPGGKDFSPNGGLAIKETFVLSIPECSAHLGLRTNESACKDGHCHM